MEPRTSLWIKAAFFAAAVVGAFFFLSAIGDIVQLVLVGGLLAYLLDPLVNRLESRGMGRTAATLVIFAGLLLAVAALLFFFLPMAAEEVRAMQDREALEDAGLVIENLERDIEARLAFLQLGEVNLIGTARAWIAEQFSHAAEYVPSIVSLLGELLLLPFITFFLLKDGRLLKKGFINIIPNRYFEFTLNVLYKMDVQLGNYLRGQLIIACVVSLLSIGALYALGVDYFFLIGVFAGLANLIPYLGPVVGATAAAAVSVLSTGTFDKVLLIVIAFTLIQVIDDAVVQPLVLARNVELHPLLILLTLIIAGQFFGIVGLLLAVPAAAILKVFVRETYENLRRYHLT